MEFRLKGGEAFSVVGGKGIAGYLPCYPFVDAEIANGTVTIAPYTDAKIASDGTAFKVVIGGERERESGYMRDCVLRVECGETAPATTWGVNFHPRTDRKTDFACEAGVRNVYWITEHAPNEFTVTGWQETDGGMSKWLCFTASGNNTDQTVVRIVRKNGPALNIQYSSDGTRWSTYFDGDAIMLSPNESVYLRGTNPNGICVSEDSYNYFTISNGDVYASGNIMSLLDPNLEIESIPVNKCFCRLFYECDNLLSAPILPATELKDGCYYEMFKGCRKLESAPNLPATSLKDWCYRGMFSDCDSLKNIHGLPATELAVGCYDSMFYNCTQFCDSLVLPAKVLAQYCYQNMFARCTNLRLPPTMMATSQSIGSCTYMFADCTSLIRSPTLRANILADGCYYGMFVNCASLTDIRTAQTEFRGTDKWVSGNFSKNGTFRCPVSLGTYESIVRGTSACPIGWTVVNEEIR